jgi:mannosyltransferase OCH1-like enzyme
MTIPNIFIQTSVYKQDQCVVDSILSKCSGWNYIHYNDEEAIRFMNENYIEEFKDIVKKYNEIPSRQHKSDLLRYYHLYITGGVFMDIYATLEVNIEDVIKDYDFFSVYSVYVPGSIFQGFIGSTPKNPIIYEALKNAYIVDICDLTKCYYLLCFNLVGIIEKNSSNMNYHLYDEREYNCDCVECYNDDDQTILFHYY